MDGILGICIGRDWRLGRFAIVISKDSRLAEVFSFLVAIRESKIFSL